MSKSFTKVLRSTCVAGLTVLLLSTARSQINSEELLNRTVTFQTQRACLVYVVGKLATDWDVPIGMEKAIGHKDECRISIDVKSATVRDLLSLIAQQEPAYTWEYVDRVINVIPTRDRNEFLSSFLQLHFDRILYPKGNDDDSYSLRKRILDLPEVTQLMKSRRVRVAGLLYSEPSRGTVLLTENQNLSCLNVTVRQYLNFVIANSKRRTWIIDMVGEKNDELLLGL